MLKKTIASVQLGVIRSEATALVRRVTEFSTHAILEKFRREVIRDPRMHGEVSRSGTRNDLNPVDLGALNVGRESNVKLAVGDVHVDSFDVGAPGTAGLCPDIKILELMARDVKGKNALTRAGDILVSFGKMKFHNVFAVGKLVRKRTHAVSLGAIDSLVLCIGDLHVAAPINDVSIHKTLVRQPDVAVGVGVRGGGASFNANRQSRCHGRGRRSYSRRGRSTSTSAGV